MDYFKFLTLIFISILYSNVSFASERVYLCRQPCTNIDIQAKQKAFSHNPGERYSFVNGRTMEVQSYTVDMEYKWGEFFLKSVKIAPTATGRVALQDLANLKAEVKSKTINLDIPADIPQTVRVENINSAYRTLISGQDEAAVALYITSQLDPIDTSGTFIGGFVNLLGKLVDLYVVVTVRFPDGSTQSYIPVGMDSHGLIFEVLPGSTVTVEGVLIPESKEDFVGEYEFISNGEGVSGFAAIANSLDVYFKTPECERVTKITVTCSTVNGEVQCTTRPITYCE